MTQMCVDTLKATLLLGANVNDTSMSHDKSIQTLSHWKNYSLKNMHVFLLTQTLVIAACLGRKSFSYFVILRIKTWLKMSRIQTIVVISAFPAHLMSL